MALKAKRSSGGSSSNLHLSNVSLSTSNLEVNNTAAVKVLLNRIAELEDRVTELESGQ